MSTMRNFKIFLRKNLYLYGALVDTKNMLMKSAAELNREDLSMIEMCKQNAEPPILTATQKALEGFQQWATTNDCELFFVVMPHRIQVEKKRAQKICKQFDIDFSALDLNRPTDIISDQLAARDINYLDLKEPLQKYALTNGDEISFKGDSHYTPKAHRFIGKWLADKIEGLEVLSSYLIN